MTLLNWLRPKTTTTTKPATRPRLGVQQLEGRDVPSADLMSAFGLGNAAGSTNARDVAVDAVGNTYMTGNFFGTVDFDPANDRLGGADVLTSRGGGDVFVAKYAADNSLVWARRMGGDESDTGRDVHVDTAGNVYLVGDFAQAADFGPVTLTSSGRSDSFVVKLNSAGAVQWANRWGTASSSEWAGGIGVDRSGNVYANVLRFGTNADGTTNWADVGVDVLKYSSTGNVVWTRWVNTKQGSIVSDLAVDGAGNVYVGGGFQMSVDFDPGRKSYLVSTGGNPSGYVFKLTTRGDFAWVTPFVGSGSAGSSAGVRSLAVDGGGNVFAGGHYRGPVDFDPGAGTTTLPTAGGFIAKLTGTGGLTWARALESDSTVSLYGLAVDAAGSVYASGGFYGTTDFDPGAGTRSVTATPTGEVYPDTGNPVLRPDIFVVKLSSAGDFAWAETFGGTGSDIGWGVAVDGAGTVHLAGRFSGTVDFDPDPNVAFDLTAPGTNSSLFLVKLRRS